jgi:hypothetical protein
MPDGSHEDWGIDELIVTEWNIQQTISAYF